MALDDRRRLLEPGGPPPRHPRVVAGGLTGLAIMLTLTTRMRGRARRRWSPGSSD
jgi:hypothetical protein